MHKQREFQTIYSLMLFVLFLNSFFSSVYYWAGFILGISFQRDEKMNLKEFFFKPDKNKVWWLIDDYPILVMAPVTYWCLIGVFSYPGWSAVIQYGTLQTPFKAKSKTNPIIDIE